MKHLGRMIVALLSAATLLSVACGVHAHRTDSKTVIVAFVGANVVPMTSENVLEDQTVLVVDGLITAVANRADVAIPSGADVIEARGKFLIPGLADMHVHLMSADKASELLLFVATGITTIRVMSGNPDVLELRTRVAGGEIIGPQIVVSSPIIDGNPPVWPAPISRVLEDPKEADSVVRELKSAGYDYLKVYHKLSGGAYDALILAARKYGMHVTGHVPFAVGIDGALAARQYSIEHFRGYDFDGASTQALERDGGRTPERFASWLAMSDTRLNQLVNATVAAGTWNCPTLVLNDLLTNARTRKAVLSNPRMHSLPAELRTRISAGLDESFFSSETRAVIELTIPKQHRLLKALSDAGAGLLAGTDSSLPFFVPGFTALDEIRNFVDAGLSPFQALRAATTAPAQFLGTNAKSGTVEAGKRADLLLLDANPLEDVTNLWKQAGVMVRGHWLPKREIDALLENLAKSNAGENAKSAS